MRATSCCSLLCLVLWSLACENALVLASAIVVFGKNVTRDGSVMLLHSVAVSSSHSTADLHLLRVPPAAVLSDNTTAADAPSFTFGYLSHTPAFINDQQLSITHCPCRSRIRKNGAISSSYAGPNGASIEGIVRVAMQRCISARCAIQCMGDLAIKHGYYYGDGDRPRERGDSASTAVIADKFGEAWVFHVFAADPGNASSTVWAAQRLADGHANVIASEFVIAEMDSSDPEHFLVSENLRSVAKDMGWWRPPEGDATSFNFQDVFSHKDQELDEDSVRETQRTSACRMWEALGRAGVFVPDLSLRCKSSRTSGGRNQFTIRVNTTTTHVGIEDAINVLKSQDATTFSLQQPIRSSVVLQTRGDLPDALGGIFWFGPYLPSTTVFMPFSCAQQSVPAVFQVGNLSEFSQESAWWAFESLARLRSSGGHWGNVKQRVESLQREAVKLQRRFADELRRLKDSKVIAQYLEWDWNAFAESVVAQVWGLSVSSELSSPNEDDTKGRKSPSSTLKSVKEEGEEKPASAAADYGRPSPSSNPAALRMETADAAVARQRVTAKSTVLTTGALVVGVLAALLVKKSFMTRLPRVRRRGYTMIVERE